MNFKDAQKILNRSAIVLALSCTFAKEVFAENTLTIPKDTKLQIVIQSDINSNAQPGADTFTAVTSEDLVKEGKMALPAGSKISGKILRNPVPMNKLDRSSFIRLEFSSIETATGIIKPIKACLLARGCVFRFRRGLSDVVVYTCTELTCGLLVGVPPNRSSSSEANAGKRLTYYGVETGNLNCSSIMLIQKGKSIDIKAGDLTKIRVLEDLKVDSPDSDISTQHQ